MTPLATSFARPGLRGILTGTLAVLIAALIFSVTAVVVWTASRQAERSIGGSLADLAAYMRESLEGDLNARWRDLRIIANAPAFSEPGAPLAAKRRILENVRSVLDDAVWIGFADTTGRVTAAAGSDREGQDVSNRLWFRLARGLEPVPGSAPAPEARVVEIGANVRNAAGEVVGVIGADIAWDWAGRLRRSLVDRSRDRHADLEVFVVDQSGAVILGQPALLGASLLGDLATHPDGFTVTSLPDGRRVLVGVSRAEATRSVGGQGWQVVVMSSAAVAFAPIDVLRWQIVAAGSVVGLMVLAAGWWVAGRIASPIQAIASRADRIGLAEAVEGVVIAAPVNASKEVLSLVASLQGMIDRLAEKEEALKTLAGSLEARVATRTAELEAANRALAEAHDAAVAATRAKSRFLAAASHDLRQPLHALSLFVAALSRRVDEGEPGRLVANMATTLGSLQDMFNALLDVSRLDAGIVAAEPRTFVIGDLLARVGEDFRAQAAADGLEFRLVPSSLTVSSDPVLLETVLRNLVGNALKFTAEGGVLVGVRRHGERATLEVHDTGPGVPPEDGERIFEEFERAKDAAHGQNDGLGLGLSIVRRVCDLLGHRVSVASRQGRGTVFRVELPIEKRAAATPQARAATDVSLAGHRILVLDDEPMIVDALARTLTDDGAMVTTAHSAEAASEEIARNHTIDLAVVDLQLGSGPDGIDLVRGWQSSRSRRLNALIVTGATDPATLARLTASGLPWMTKPVAVPALRARIAGLVRA